LQHFIEKVPFSILTISKRAPEYHRVRIDFLESNPLMSISLGVVDDKNIEFTRRGRK